jgi:hypothetical protein
MHSDNLPIEETVAMVPLGSLQCPFSAMPLLALIVSILLTSSASIITKSLEGTIATMAKDACMALVICSMLKAWIQEMERNQGSSHVLIQLFFYLWVVTLLMSRRSCVGENEWVGLLPYYGAAVEKWDTLKEDGCGAMATLL